MITVLHFAFALTFTAENIGLALLMITLHAAGVKIEVHPWTRKMLAMCVTQNDEPFEIDRF